MANKKFYVIIKVGNGRPRMFYFDGSPSTKQWEFSFDITTPEKKEESVQKMKERMLDAQKYRNFPDWKRTSPSTGVTSGSLRKAAL